MGKNFTFYFYTHIAVIFLLCASLSAVTQVPTNGDYRSRQSGEWKGSTTWQVRSGGTWANTSTPPTSVSNVYIQNGHVVTHTLTGAAICKDLHVGTPGNSTPNYFFEIIDIYGKLRAYTGTIVTTGVDGAFYTSQSSSIMARLSGTTLNFRGNTRNITNTGEWGYHENYFDDIYFRLNAGQTGSFQTEFGAHLRVVVETGTVNMGTNCLVFGSWSSSDFRILTVNAGATFASAQSGTLQYECVSYSSLNNLEVYGKILLTGAAPHINCVTASFYPGSTMEYGGSGNQTFATEAGASITPITTYRNLIFSGSGNKTAPANFQVKEDITISGSAVLVMGSRTADITGDWTSYGQAGLNEGTSTINFDSTGAQSINTTGGENFYVLRKSNSGTLTLNSNVNIIAAGNLDMELGIIDANTNTFSGTATSALNMTNGTIKLAKLNTTLPEFLNTTYNLSGGTIQLDGAGVQTLRGARNYRNLTFSNSGTKGITSAINTITGTVTVSGTVVLDVLNNTMGGTGTNLTMSGTSLYRTAGSSQVKPDAAGTYTLGASTTIEFNNNLAGLESVRFIGSATVNYNDVIVSGTSVGTASLATGIRFQIGGSFTVKNGAVFKQTNTTGFSNATTSSISNVNTPSIILEAGSTIEYNGDNQAISNQTITTPSNANYEKLLLSGTGNKTAPAGTLTIKGDFTKMTNTTFIHNAGTVIMNGTAAQDHTAVYPFMKFNNFTNNNTVDLSINNEMSVVKELAFGANSKLNLQTGSHIILGTDILGCTKYLFYI